MSNKKKPAKKATVPPKKEPKRSVMRLFINGSLDDVLRATFVPPPKKD